MDETLIRKRRALILFIATTVIVACLSIFLIWSMRSLILPTIIGALSAYICSPLLNLLKRNGVPRGLAILFLFGIFFLTIALLASQIKNIIPDEKGKFELRVRIQYKLNEKYKEFMGIDSTGEKGNFVYNLAGKELNPIKDNINGILIFDEDEKLLFEKYCHGYKGLFPVDEKYIGYYNSNLKTVKNTNKVVAESANEKEDEVAVQSEEEEESKLSLIINVISLWIVMPFIFLFLLIDDGEIRKSLVRLIPNRYFELALTVIDNVDEAIGNYLRGTILECSLVGLTFIVCLAIIGVDLKWALIIGVIAGMANAIPFLGPAIGLVVGACYALIAEDVSSILPFMNPNNLLIGVLVTVGIAQGMDNAVFQPIVLGGAVNLHPLVVVLGVMGGSVIFGFVGMLFAIPTIVVVKEISSTLFKQLRAYYII